MTPAPEGSPTDKALRFHLRHLRLEGKSERTVYHREQVLLRLAAFLPVPLLDATPEQLYDWRVSLKLSDSTVCTYVSHVRMFYQSCVGRELIALNPVRDVPVPPLPHREPRPISEENLAHALEYANRPIRVWLVLAAWCGMRAKEIALIKADSIRMNETQPYIRIAFDATKGKRERGIPLSPFLVGELRMADLPSSGYVFRRPDGRHFTPWLVSKLANQHLHAMGIADTLHSLRHRFATQAYQVDFNLRGVQELLGHAVLQSTAGYAAIDGSALARTVNAIPSPLQKEAS